MVIDKSVAPGQIARLVTNCPPQSCTALLCYNNLVFFLYFFAASSTQGGIIGTMVGVVVALVVVIIIMGVVIGVLVARNRQYKLSTPQHAV